MERMMAAILSICPSSTSASLSCLLPASPGSMPSKLADSAHLLDLPELHEKVVEGEIRLA